MKRFFLFLIAATLLSINIKADEGVWIPLLLEQMNEKEMQALGMQITAQDIYDINNSSLKDAIVHFGGGCTGEVVSNEGLLLTNHHCGYSYIQKHSTLDHNYLKDGFWAMNRGEELSNPGLTVTFLIEMEEVTAQVLAGVTATMSIKEQNAIIRKNSDALIAKAIEGTHYKAVIRSFYHGNKYYIFLNEVFEDVRLVGAPPSNIGKFGGDTDNWMWPRHTGDFSIFRIYADKDNNPAKYSPDNVPYTPKKFLEIAIDGVEEDDFTFVFGYPGRTNEYAPSYEVDNQVNSINPIRIDLRGQRLDIMKAAMNKDMATRIKYSAKVAGIANGWKKMQGETIGIARNNAIAKKLTYENSFQEWATENDRTEYTSLLSTYKALYDTKLDYDLAFYYLIEAGISIELLSFARGFNRLIEASSIDTISPEIIDNLVKRQMIRTRAFYKDYDNAIDQEVCAKMLKAYSIGISKEFQAKVLINADNKYKGNFERYAEDLYAHSIFADSTALLSLLEHYKTKNAKILTKDKAFQLGEQLIDFYSLTVRPQLTQLDAKSDSLNTLYMRAIMEMREGENLYPDANSTLRVSYGVVKGFEPKDGVEYQYYTTLEGIMEKEDPAVFDYVVEDKLKELYNKKDYGDYADKDGTMHVGFIATNHTTGGNSGSPVLDANGRLIGLNFDRCWESTMSDLNYDPRYCRNITLDVRYLLFIVDKFAGANHLIDEMVIINE